MSDQRYSIIPGAFAEDSRADVYHFRILNFIGRHTDNEGWCRLEQGKIAEALGVTCECVNRKIAEVVAWGYVEKHEEETGGDSSSSGSGIWYRTIMDRPKITGA